MKLDDPVTVLPFVGPSYAKKLEKLDVETIKDLFNHIPRRYLDFRNTTNIREAKIGEVVSIKGEVTSAISQYTKKGRQMQIVRLTDDTASINAIWFNQRYLLSTLKKGTRVTLAGEISWFSKTPAMISPEYELATSVKQGVHTGRLVPIYPETARLSSKWLRARMVYAFDEIGNNIEEYLSGDVLKKYKLVGLLEAYQEIHFPKTLNDVKLGRSRLAFDELLMLQLTSIMEKLSRQESKQAKELLISKKDLQLFINELPFELTISQKRSINEIMKDLAKDYPMNRLLEGDVGSGKTVVAAAAAFVSSVNGFQTVVMAPTQILATQHYETLKDTLSVHGMRVSLITSAVEKKSLGRSDVVVGTHSLIHKRASFDKVAIVVIDEQHRFGVDQRARLIKRTTDGDVAPDVLTMTATPIPRTVALAAYGELDLSTLDELPKGRKVITTWLVPEGKRSGAYGWIDEQIGKSGVQVFIVCPLIEESESEHLTQVKAASVEYSRIKKIFTNRSIGLLHGRMKASDKDDVLDKFRKGSIDILVSTPVIEVGIDVPNATIMLIEAPDRFGLAQLHQLRGRVGRGKHKSYCLLMNENKSPKVATRLKALQQTRSGFELAELDLKMRGPGEVFGTRQSGFAELKIARWQDTDLIKTTKKVAVEIANNPQNHGKLILELEKRQAVAN